MKTSAGAFLFYSFDEKMLAARVATEVVRNLKL